MPSLIQFQESIPDEAYLQLNILYHDRRDGAVYCCVKDDTRFLNSRMPSPEDIPVQELMDAKQDTYVSLNSFNGIGRENARVLARGVFYIDIDCHAVNDNPFYDAEDSVQDTIALLKEAFEQEQLPVPTFVNHTGRGLAVYYVLDHSIPWQNKEAKRARFKFEYTYECLIRAYTRVLVSTGVTVDGAVLDPARVGRVAGTYNTQAKKTCRMLFVNRDAQDNVCFVSSMDELLECLTEEDLTFEKDEPVYAIHGSALGLAKRRVEEMFDLARLRAGSAIPAREMTAMVCFNYAMQYLLPEEAYRLLERLNELFYSPLPTWELRAVARGLLRRGEAYKFTNRKLISKLGITKREQEELGLQETKRQRERRLTKEAHQQAAGERKAAIAEYLKSHAQESYKEIAVLFCCSESTIRRIAREFGIVRNYCAKRFAVKEEMVRGKANNFKKVVTDNNSEQKEQSVQILSSVLRSNKTILEHNKVNYHFSSPSTVPTMNIPMSLQKMDKMRERKIDYSDYAILKCAGLAENMTYLLEKHHYTVNPIVLWRSQVKTELQKQTLSHILKELTKYGLKRLERFLVYAEEECCSEDLQENFDKLKAFWKVDNLLSLDIPKRKLSEKQIAYLRNRRTLLPEVPDHVPYCDFMI